MPKWKEESLLDVKTQFEIVRENFRRSLYDNNLTEAEPQDVAGLPKLKMPWSRVTNNSHKIKYLFQSLLSTPESLVRLVTRFPAPFHQWIIPRFAEGCLKKALNSSPGLVYVLNNLELTPRNLIFKLVKKFYGNEHFRNIINTIEDLYSVMQANTSTQKHLLGALGKKHLRYLIDTKESLDSLKTILQEENYEFLVNSQLGDAHVSRLVTASAKAKRSLVGTHLNIASEFKHVAQTSLGLFGGKKSNKRVFDFEIRGAEEANKRVRTLDEEEEKKEFSPMRPMTPASR